MRKTKKRLFSLLMAAVMLLGIHPPTAYAADTTIALSVCEISWDNVLTDAEGNTFRSGYGLRAEDNPFGYALIPMMKISISATRSLSQFPNSIIPRN